MIDTELSNINLNRKKETAVIITSYQPNIEASNILRTSINSLLKFKDESVSIWIFDVGSPKSNNLIKKKNRLLSINQKKKRKKEKKRTQNKGQSNEY